MIHSRLNIFLICFISTAAIVSFYFFVVHLKFKLFLNKGYDTFVVGYHSNLKKWSWKWFAIAIKDEEIFLISSTDIKKPLPIHKPTLITDNAIESKLLVLLDSEKFILNLRPFSKSEKFK